MNIVSKNEYQCKRLFEMKNENPERGFFTSFQGLLFD